MIGITCYNLESQHTRFPRKPGSKGLRSRISRFFSQDSADNEDSSPQLFHHIKPLHTGDSPPGTPGFLFSQETLRLGELLSHQPVSPERRVLFQEERAVLSVTVTLDWVSEVATSPL